MFIERHYITNNKVSQTLPTSSTIIFKRAQLQQDRGLTMVRYIFTLILYNLIEYSLLCYIFTSSYEHPAGSTLIDKSTTLLFTYMDAWS